MEKEEGGRKLSHSVQLLFGYLCTWRLWVACLHSTPKDKQDLAVCVPYYLGYQKYRKYQEFICNLDAVPGGFGLVEKICFYGESDMFFPVFLNIASVALSFPVWPMSMREVK